MPRSSLVACIALVVLSLLPAASGAPVAVGSGDKIAHVLIDFKDGASYDFQVSFADPGTTGIGLLDIIQANSALTTERLYEGAFINGITYDGHTNSGYAGGEDWWHYWIKDGPQASWVSPWDFGAAGRTVSDGFSDGWVYGSANPPMPEPATMLLLAAGGLAVFRRRS